MKTIQRLVLVVGMIAILLPATPGYSQAGDAKAAKSQQLEGSWILTVTPVVPPGVPPIPSFVTYLTISTGGALVGTDRTKPFANLQHGAWEHTGPKLYAATQVQDLFDATGAFTGVFTVRQKIKMTGSNTFVGVANVYLVNPAGETVFERCARTEGARITMQDFTMCDDLEPQE